MPVVFGADWLVVVADFGVWEDGDWTLWPGAELGEEVDEEFAGADEFEDEFELVRLCAAGGTLFFGCSLGDWANAPVPSIKPIAVVINKCSLMFHSWAGF
ncbi:MAG: hypothetical protein ACXWKP_17830 [Bradyrhizobium sp.]